MDGNFTLQGVTGTLHFNENGDNLGPWMVHSVQDGKKVPTNFFDLSLNKMWTAETKDEPRGLLVEYNIQLQPLIWPGGRPWNDPPQSYVDPVPLRWYCGNIKGKGKSVVTAWTTHYRHDTSAAMFTVCFYAMLFLELVGFSWWSIRVERKTAFAKITKMKLNVDNLVVLSSYAFESISFIIICLEVYGDDSCYWSNEKDKHFVSENAEPDSKYCVFDRQKLTLGEGYLPGFCTLVFMVWFVFVFSILPINSDTMMKLFHRMPGGPMITRVAAIMLPIVAELLMT